MPTQMQGRWRGRVTTKNAGFDQRIVVTGASSGNGIYSGVVGTTFEVDGNTWQIELQWNDGAGSGWQESAVLEGLGSSSPLVLVMELRADDGSAGDGDYDDLVVWLEHLDPVFEVVQRPFALDRGTLSMLPDGIFDASQGVQYMGVRIRNTWLFDWHSSFPATGMKIGIAPTSRVALASQGIQILDNWSTQEEECLGQVVDAGFVRVNDLTIGEERLIYFKVNVIGASPSKPIVGFVAQRDAFDPNYDAPTRIVRKRIFVSKTQYDAATKEVVVALPEGRLRARLKSVVIDSKAATAAANDAIPCVLRPSCDDDCLTLEECKECLGDVELQGQYALLGGFPSGGRALGTGADDWCRFKPFAWLPVEFEYVIEPTTPFSDQFGPLPFDDPWWKVALWIAAALLLAGSLLADYLGAANDPHYIIGNLAAKGGVANNVDCALSDLNGSRSINLGYLDARSSDRNNEAPIVALNSIIELDRSAVDAGISDALLGDIVWKSGARSATTRGRVESIADVIPVDYGDDGSYISGTVTFVDQLEIVPLDPPDPVQPVSQKGDSGSVWVNLASGRPVGLNFSGDQEDRGISAGANPLRAVLARLNAIGAGIRFNP
jgi:hypothetical protein